MPSHQTAISDLALQALTLLKALSTPTSPSYSCSLARLTHTQRIPLAFTLADRSFPFALKPQDLAAAYTTYETMALIHCQLLHPPREQDRCTYCKCDITTGMSRGVGNGHGSKFACNPCFLANHCAHCYKPLRDSIVSYSEPSGKPGYICTPCMDKHCTSTLTELKPLTKE